MNMSEYMQKKQQMEKDKQKSIQDRMKELQEAEKKAMEIREALKNEKKKEIAEKIHNFNIFGMRFRPWTLNDMVILLVIAIIVVGGLSFVPGKDISSDTDANKESFFTKLFGGFTVKSVGETSDESVSNEEVQDNTEESSAETSTDTSSETTGNSAEDTSTETSEETQGNPVDFDFDVKYQDSSFAVINISNVDILWYTLSVRNSESYPILCNIKHYVNNNLKNDQSTITIQAGDKRDINLKEVASDTVDTLSKIKLEISCSDGRDPLTENTQNKLLKFYFS